MRRGGAPVRTLSSVLVAALVVLATPSVVGADDLQFTYGPGAAPTITSVKQEAAGVAVRWTVPAGHESTNIHWSTDKSTVAPAPNDPSIGEEMACFASGPSNGVHNCTGGSDLASAATSYTIRGLKPGSYYVQVMTYGLRDSFVNGRPAGQVHYYGFTPVTPFSVSATTPTTAPAAKYRLEPRPVVAVPADNGNRDCRIARNALAIMNQLDTEHNARVDKWNRWLVTKTKLEGGTLALYNSIQANTVAARRLVTFWQAVGNATCAKAPRTQDLGGAFTPIPIPPSNGKRACNVDLDHLRYLNQEIGKVFNNLRTTAPTQATRLRQLQTRYEQLRADLRSAWPRTLTDCDQFS